MVHLYGGEPSSQDSSIYLHARTDSQACLHLTLCLSGQTDSRLMLKNAALSAWLPRTGLLCGLGLLSFKCTF